MYHKILVTAHSKKMDSPTWDLTWDFKGWKGLAELVAGTLALSFGKFAIQACQL